MTHPTISRWSVLALVVLVSSAVVWAAGLGTTPIWWVAGPRSDVQMGFSVASAGDVNGDGFPDVVVSAPGIPVGEVYVYFGSAGGLATTPSVTFSGFGVSVAGAGDVNGDGYDDVLVGDIGGANGLGIAALYLGSPSGTATTPAWQVVGTQGYGSLGAPGHFAVVVAGAGDVNGDGYADILISDPFHDSDGLTDNGAVYLYLGSPTGPSSTPDWTFSGAKSGSNLSDPVAAAGDVNGDGYADVIVSERGYEAGQTSGRVLVFHGASSGLHTAPDWIMNSKKCCIFGSGVASAGDVNGDGFDDVIIGQNQYNNGAHGATLTEGRAFIFLGSSRGLSKMAATTLSGDQVGSFFGDVVSPAGDVNADGFDDVLVLEPSHTGGGRVFAYLGSARGVSTTPAWFVDATDPGSSIIRAIATAGDVNGDGHADVIVGDPDYADSIGSSAGRALIYPGTN